MTREITISPALNGYVCSVGCQRIVFTARSTMLVEIDRYLEDPAKVEKEYLKAAVNPMPEPPRPTPANDPQPVGTVGLRELLAH